MEEEDRICGKCDKSVKVDDKVVNCFTCKQEFHINCQGVSLSKYEFLSGENDSIVWFCRTCRRTTAGMFQHVANLEIRLKAIEEEREKEKHELSVLRKLVTALNQTVNSVEDSIVNVKEENDNIRDAVTCMLNEIPQCTSIEARFSSIENTLQEVSSHSITELYDNVCSQSSLNSRNFSTVEVANELDDRQRRKGNLVLHNVPENSDQECDEDAVKSILKHVVDKEVDVQRDPITNRPRIYRLGKRIPGKNRSVKCHLNSEQVCEQVLSQSRRLSESSRYNQVVLQEDLTPMQRSHIKQLVHEKKRRNCLASKNNQDPDWIIRGGKLCKKNESKVLY